MNLSDDFRDAHVLQRLADEIRGVATRPWTLMEVCGGQTHTIVKYGLDQLLPETVELLHGPGCPVCVTPLDVIDQAHAIASRSDVIFCSFGDMLRVPGSRGDLLARKATGADVRVLYSPLDALPLAEAHPDKQVVFFAIGFETTAPATATLAKVARQRGLTNVSLLVSHVRVPPALAFLLDDPQNRVRAFLGPGHVCTVMGTREYEPICATYGVPVVVTGFEPVDLLDGVLAAVRQLERGEANVENRYRRVVREDGNASSRRLLGEVFEVCDRTWRGIGRLPNSGLRLSGDYLALDAARRFGVDGAALPEPTACISGQVLRGLKRPSDCPQFGTGCTPQTPLGATMVSSEGACSTYFHFRGRPSTTKEGAT